MEPQKTDYSQSIVTSIVTTKARIQYKDYIDEMQFRLQNGEGLVVKFLDKNPDDKKNEIGVYHENKDGSRTPIEMQPGDSDHVRMLAGLLQQNKVTVSTEIKEYNSVQGLPIGIPLDMTIGIPLDMTIGIPLDMKAVDVNNDGKFNANDVLTAVTNAAKNGKGRM